MQQLMSTELYWLVLTTAMTGIFWMPYLVNRMMERGMWTTMYDPAPDAGPKAEWAQRMMGAHNNAVENLVIFAPLVLALHVTGMGTDTTATACMVYFFARLGHYLVFTMAIPLLRTVTFMAGFFAQVVLALTLLGMM